MFFTTAFLPYTRCRTSYFTLFLLVILTCFSNCSPSRRASRTKQPIGRETAEVNSIKLVPATITLQKGNAFSLNVPDGYHISVAYEGLKRLRFMTLSPDGRLFATDMYDLTDNKRSKVYIFEDWDETTKRFKTIRTYLQHLRNVNQVAFYRENNTDYIYVPETGRLNRYVYHAGDNAPNGKPELIATFPAYGLSYKYGGWHLTRSVTFHNNKLYVSVGSSCNACVEKEDVRATILEMDPDGRNSKIYATGLRNSVGIKWVDNELWATGMGQDKLGLDMPEDIFVNIKPGQFYGWPYYYHYRDKIFADTLFQDSAKRRSATIPPVVASIYCGFKAHSAPLGFDHFSHFSDPLLNNGFIVALHGSTDVSLQRGNAVVRIDGRGKYTPVIDGFLNGSTQAGRNGRPCDVMMKDDHSFFVTDDMRGVLYYIWR